MELFKVAAQSQMDTYAAAKANTATDTRAVEQTRIQPNSASENKVEDPNAANTSEQINKEELDRAIERLNKNMQELETNVRFGYNDKISINYVSVLEANTGNEIRKIPSDQAMKLTESFRNIIGMIFDKKE